MLLSYRYRDWIMPFATVSRPTVTLPCPSFPTISLLCPQILISNPTSSLLSHTTTVTVPYASSDPLPASSRLTEPSVTLPHAQILKRLKGRDHIANLLGSGKLEKYQYMVMTLLGECLCNLLRSVYTVDEGTVGYGRPIDN